MITRELKKQEIVSQIFKDDGNFPNNPKHPLIIYRDTIPHSEKKEAEFFENLFASNGWSNSWRNGIYSFHHYHSVTHEVLGIYKGSAKVQFGGPNGSEFQVNKGDVVLIPAGVAHKNLGSSGDFACVGAYPNGKDYDMNYGKKEELENALLNISMAPIPYADPVYGRDGLLLELWKQ